MALFILSILLFVYYWGTWKAPISEPHLRYEVKTHFVMRTQDTIQFLSFSIPYPKIDD